MTAGFQRFSGGHSIARAVVQAAPRERYGVAEDNADKTQDDDRGRCGSRNRCRRYERLHRESLQRSRRLSGHHSPHLGCDGPPGGVRRGRSSHVFAARTIERVRETGVAIGHFNISDFVLLKAVVSAARELNLPVLVGLSEGERASWELVPLRLSCEVCERTGVPHFSERRSTHSLATGIEAAKAGFDSIVFDLSALPFEENVRQTRRAVEALKAINESMLVEGEIGGIGTGSEIHDSSPDLSKGLSTRNKQNSSSRTQAWTSSLPPSAICTACSGAWSKEKPRSIWTSRG